jgi:hypothetical protein
VTLYSALLSFHVVLAILGLGPLAAVALGRAELSFGLMRASLVAMLLSGIGLELALGKPWHGFWWFRISVVLFVLVGVLTGLAHRRPAAARSSALGACVLIAIITVLMELKPA